MSTSIDSKKTINNKFICCECNYTFSKSKDIKTNCWCKNPICVLCYEKHKIRAKKIIGMMNILGFVILVNWIKYMQINIKIKKYIYMLKLVYTCNAEVSGSNPLVAYVTYLIEFFL